MLLSIALFDLNATSMDIKDNNYLLFITGWFIRWIHLTRKEFDHLHLVIKNCFESIDFYSFIQYKNILDCLYLSLQIIRIDE